METDLADLVQATVIKENKGNRKAAFADLSRRYVSLCFQLERAESLYSKAYARECTPTIGAIDVPPDVITDDWIKEWKERDDG